MDMWQDEQCHQPTEPKSKAQYHLTLDRMAVIKEAKHKIVGESMEELEPLCIIGGNAK